MSTCRYCGDGLSPFKMGEIADFCNSQCRDAWLDELREQEGELDALEAAACDELLAVRSVEVYGQKFPVESCSIDSDGRVVLRFSKETVEVIKRHIKERAQRCPLTGRRLCPQCGTREGVHGGCSCGHLAARGFKGDDDKEQGYSL